MTTAARTAAREPGRPGTREVQWMPLGSFLDRRDLLVIPEAKRRDLRGEWEAVCREERDLDDRLLIGLVGGTGVGKSTFVNALAGQEVSRSGDRRPTTDRVVVYRHLRNELAPHVPTADLALPHVLHENDALERVAVLDFPDFDSTDASHREILGRYLPYLDVLFIVVDDVKYGDRRLYDLLRGLSHDRKNVYCLFNKVDRLSDRYGPRVRAVTAEILEDLRDKLAVHAGLPLEPRQTFAISALRVFQGRAGGVAAGDGGAFAAVEELLRAYRDRKRRVAAKELNLELRKRALAERLEREVLGGEIPSLLNEASLVLESSREGIDRALEGTPVELLSEADRRRLRRRRLRRVGRAWALPFSLFFTLFGELRRAPEGSSVLDGEAGLGRRIYRHYRPFFEALGNLSARFRSEIAGSPLASGRDDGSENPRLDEAGLIGWSVGLGREFQDAVASSERRPGRGRRFAAHVPALGSVALAVWSLVYPLFEAVALEGGVPDAWLGELLRSFVRALNPVFLTGVVVGVLLVYGLTALFLWGREVHRLDASVERAESRLRERVRERGDQTLEALSRRVALIREQCGEVALVTGAE